MTACKSELYRNDSVEELRTHSDRNRRGPLRGTQGRWREVHAASWLLGWRAQSINEWQGAAGSWIFPFHFLCQENVYLKKKARRKERQKLQKKGTWKAAHSIDSLPPTICSYKKKRNKCKNVFLEPSEKMCVFISSRTRTRFEIILSLVDSFSAEGLKIQILSSYYKWSFSLKLSNKYVWGRW